MVTDQYTFSEIFSNAYYQILHPHYAVNTLGKCGLVFFYRNKFNESDYMPALVTDQTQENWNPVIPAKNEIEPQRAEILTETEPFSSNLDTCNCIALNQINFCLLFSEFFLFYST